MLTPHLFKKNVTYFKKNKIHKIKKLINENSLIAFNQCHIVEDYVKISIHSTKFALWWGTTIRIVSSQFLQWKENDRHDWCTGFRALRMPAPAIIKQGHIKVI